ncbi:hypothetical protein [Halotia branconii]|uniref:Adhesin n=1 Tax=Halotia branconii CENA392 TaxID=1539056 RepID=A0AAJ6PCQ9_9CYAN|nr:hypothetical protein [Halotia branconii]WGV29041.1 hypothetical protein QI031_31270 [Halotia branconii CENA392]
MKRKIIALSTAFAFSTLALPSIAFAGSASRVIPGGTVGVSCTSLSETRKTVTYNFLVRGDKQYPAINGVKLTITGIDGTERKDISAIIPPQTVIVRQVEDFVTPILSVALTGSAVGVNLQGIHNYEVSPPLIAQCN